jgi:hypothetical protein
MSDSLLMLLEMIEEVLEEQNTSLEYLVHKKLGKKNVDSKKFETNAKNQELKNRVTYYVDTFEREQLANQVLPLLKSKLSDGQEISNIYSADGTTIIGHKIKHGRSIIFKYQIKPTRRINEAEQMESVIARATGNEKSEYDPKFDPNDGKLNRMRNAAQALNLPPLKKLKNQKLPADGLYKMYGAKSGTPKTDLIGLEGSPKYSVKKSGGSQFVSAQGPESAALWHIALKNSVTDAKINNAVSGALGIVPQNIVNYFSNKEYSSVRGLPDTEKAQFNAQLGEALFKKIIKDLGIDSNKFKQQFVYEGLSGKEKFNDGLGTATEVLTWSPKGDPAIEPPETIEEFINSKGLDKIKLRVSDRGGKRGGSIRGDILDKPVQNESIVIEVVDDKEQEAVEAVRQFIKSNNITPEQMSKLLQLAIPAINESVGNPTVQAQSPLPGVQELIDFLKKHGNAGLEAVKGYIERGEAFFDKIGKSITTATASAISANEAAPIIKQLDARYKQMGIVKFLDYLIASEPSGEINMKPLYDTVLGKEVEFGDFEVEEITQKYKLPLEESEGT